MGLVTCGGDALAESERLYDGNSLKAVTSQKEHQEKVKRKN